jgi:hypothetical protein
MIRAFLSSKDANVERQIRVEIKSKDEFWGRAFYVEWDYQFPDRKLIRDGANHFFAELEWLGDLERVGSQTFSSVNRAPDNPRRRKWMSALISRRDRK